MIFFMLVAKCFGDEGFNQRVSAERFDNRRRRTTRDPPQYSNLKTEPYSVRLIAWLEGGFFPAALILIKKSQNPLAPKSNQKPRIS
jgi:hypothetical protein